jgi:hypothetical protein
MPPTADIGSEVYALRRLDGVSMVNMDEQDQDPGISDETFDWNSRLDTASAEPFHGWTELQEGLTVDALQTAVMRSGYPFQAAVADVFRESFDVDSYM